MIESREGYDLIGSCNEQSAIHTHGESQAEPLVDVNLARAGDHDAFSRLVSRFRPLIKAQCRSLFAPGASVEDLRQEALIGFFKATRDYKANLGSFSAFATLCVRRQVITFVKTATRKKHYVLNKAASLDAPIYSDNSDTLLQMLSFVPHSADATKDDDILDFLQALYSTCSKFERAILNLYGRGYTFEEMASETGKHYKAVDNGIWRVKVKARKLVASRQSFQSL